MKIAKLVEETWADMKVIVEGGYGQSPRKERVTQFITRIGEAALSGECADLDKLLGVVGRLEQEPRTSFYSRGVERSLQGWIRNRFKQGARTFIAVKGTGKEEGD